MKFGLFYEHQLPQPAGGTWDEDAERRLYQDALDQVELADRAGIDYVWEVEHHCPICCRRRGKPNPRPFPTWRWARSSMSATRELTARCHVGTFATSSRPCAATNGPPITSRTSAPTQISRIKRPAMSGLMNRSSKPG